jgi:predicted nucleic acid-binding protein
MTVNGSAFLDSNVLIYAFTDDARAVRAQQLLGRSPIISVQCLNEFTHVARRKLGMSWPQLRGAISDLRALCRPVLGLNEQSFSEALRIAERHGLSIFDSSIIASALHAGCETLWSEDMQHGMMIDRRLRIANPFRTEG